MNPSTEQKKVIIIGASGHGKVVADIVLQNGDSIVGFFDGNQDIKEFIGYKNLGTEKDYISYPDCYFVVAIGNAAIRERIVSSMPLAKWYTAIHPTAIISPIDTTIGEGSVVMAGAIINAGAKLGKHCIANSGSIIEHDNIIEDYVHISVGAKTTGAVHVGKSTWVGAGATIINNLSICSDCMIGAGTVVINNIEESGTYVGVPARKVK